MTKPTRRLSYANVVSTLALILVVGGGGIAVAAVAKNSVGSAQVKKNSLKGKDIKESSLKLPASAKVAEGPVSDVVPLTTGNATHASLTWQAPADGFVKVTGQAAVSAEEPDGHLLAFIRQDGDTEGFTYWEAGDADSFFDEHNTFAAVMPVTKGMHTYELRLAEKLGVGSTVHGETVHAQLIVEFFPQGSADVQSPPVP